jgi:hypothetical protein
VTHFEYISVLVSIVIGFSLTEILGGWGRLLRSRQRVRFSLVHALASGLVLLLVVQFWSGFWEYRVVASWGFLPLLGLVSDALTFVVIGFFMVPPLPAAGTLDLGEYYWHNRGWIYGLVGVGIVQLALLDALVARQPVLHPENAVRAAALALVIVLAASRSERVHAALLGLGYALFFAFVAVAVQSP